MDPGSEIYRQFIIFLKYSQDDLKCSEFNLTGRSLPLAVVTGFQFEPGVSRAKRKEKQRERQDQGKGGVRLSLVSAYKKLQLGSPRNQQFIFHLDSPLTC